MRVESRIIDYKIAIAYVRIGTEQITGSRGDTPTPFRINSVVVPMGHKILAPVTDGKYSNDDERRGIPCPPSMEIPFHIRALSDKFQHHICRQDNRNFPYCITTARSGPYATQHKRGDKKSPENPVASNLAPDYRKEHHDAHHQKIYRNQKTFRPYAQFIGCKFNSIGRQIKTKYNNYDKIVAE